MIAAGGLLLWFTRRRAQRAVRGTTGRRRALGLHGTVGAWVAVGLIFLSATGLTWSTYAGQNVTELRTSLGQLTPEVDAGAAAGGEHAEHGGHAGHGADGGDGGDGSGHVHDHGVDGSTPGGIDLDTALAAARSEGLTNPVEILPPADASSAYVVRQIQRSWPEKQDAVAVDPSSGVVTDVVRFEDFPVLAKLSRWGIDLHTGILFGLPNQILLGSLALSLMFLIVWGYRLWWLRGRGSAFGRPLPRGAWRAVPLSLGLPLLAVVALVGWFVPLLGLSLLAFLAVDIVLGALARRRAGRAAPQHQRPRAQQRGDHRVGGQRALTEPPGRRGVRARVLVGGDGDDEDDQQRHRRHQRVHDERMQPGAWAGEGAGRSSHECQGTSGGRRPAPAGVGAVVSPG